MRSVSLLFLIACSQPHLGQLEAEVAIGLDGGRVDPSVYEYCKTITVSGNVFYNDLRSEGRFSLRSSPTNTPGTRNKWNSGNNKNYLGLLDARVDLYEVDLNYGEHAGCIPTEKFGSATVGADGRWSWHGQVCDHCNAESNEGDESLAIHADIVLEHCDSERCFRVAEPDDSAISNHFADDWFGQTRARQYRGATATAPVVIGPATTSVDLGTDYYQASGSQSAGVSTDTDAKAANIFASLVDVTRKVQTELGVVYNEPEVSAYYPDISSLDWTHSHEGGFLCVAEPDPGKWIVGDEAPHEFGHLIHFSRWNHHGKWVYYCYDSNGNPTNSGCPETSTTYTWANAAFKEGWADFIAAVTYNKTGSTVGCDDRETDPAIGCPAGQVCTTGRHYSGDVTTVLCDLWDNHNSDCNGAACDAESISLPDLVAGLRAEWNAAGNLQTDYNNSSENNPTNAALGVCEFAQALIGASANTLDLTETLEVTGLNCNLY
jgi:hypothetical protein